jgi:hypothetical protein
MTLDEIDAAEAARRPPGVALPARARRSRTLPPAVISRRNRDEHDLALAHERLSDHEASYTRVKRKVGRRHVDRALPAPFAPISRVEEFVRGSRIATHVGRARADRIRRARTCCVYEARRRSPIPRLVVSVVISLPHSLAFSFAPADRGTRETAVRPHPARRNQPIASSAS